jgi:NAD+ synthase
MQEDKIISHISDWLKNYALNSNQKGFVVGISGGIDSALTSILCAKTGLNVLLVSLPLRQKETEYSRALKHIDVLKKNYANVDALDIDLSDLFCSFENCLPNKTTENKLAMANSRSRLRMTTLYAIAQSNQLLVAGTGNKIEDFGVGFFTKYGDGGVDISPIADLTKSEVRKLAKYLNVIPEILEAEPTDGLWEEDRTDEKQMGASYPELEWAMEYKGNEEDLNERQLEVLRIYRRLNSINQHKMLPIPVCKIEDSLKI